MKNQSDICIQLIKHDLNVANSEDARIALERVSKLVTPLMKRRGWKVGCLMEFYPSNESLLGLNINRGKTIKIRLRSPKDRNCLLEFEHILGTMIHELVHIEIAPHSAEFYKKMDELFNEVESTSNLQHSFSIANSGYTAFSGSAHKLSTNISRTNKKNAKELQAEAALKRSRNSQLTSGSGQVLGTLVSSQLLKPKEAAALAALRRHRDFWCPCSEQFSNNEKQMSFTTIGKDSVTGGQVGGGVDPGHGKDGGGDTGGGEGGRGRSLGKGTSWTCGVCTYLNANVLNGFHEVCEMCEERRGDHDHYHYHYHDGGGDDTDTLSISRTIGNTSSSRSQDIHKDFSSTVIDLTSTSPRSTFTSGKLMLDDTIDACGSWTCVYCTYRNSNSNIVADSNSILPTTPRYNKRPAIVLCQLCECENSHMSTIQTSKANTSALEVSKLNPNLTTGHKADYNNEGKADYCEEWTCKLCTFVSVSLNSSCDMCNTPR